MKVLVAFANETSVEVLRQFLTDHDCEVDVVARGIDCLPKVRQLVPDVFVLDRDLPCGGGDGVLACMRVDAEAGRVPVSRIPGAVGPD